MTDASYVSVLGAGGTAAAAIATDEELVLDERAAGLLACGLRAIS